MDHLTLAEFMELNRKATSQEEKLLDHLIKKSSITFPTDWKKNLLVRPMEDGKMGSLYLFPKSEVKGNRKFGKQISEFQFMDKDGVEVIVSLNVDSNDNLLVSKLVKTMHFSASRFSF